MEDLDKYLKGQMGEEERQRFEQKLAGDPTLQTELELQEGLRQLKWKKKVAQVSIARKQWQKQRFKKNVGYGLALILGLVIIFMAYKRFTSEKSAQGKTAPGSPTEKNAPVIEDAQTKQKEPPSKSKPKYQGPIADGGVVDHFDVEPSSGMRNVYTELDSLTIQVLDTLLSRTMQVEPDPADENWRKALEQLSKGKPQAAKPYIFALEKRDARESKWLLAIALMAEGRSEEATTILETIAKTPDHPRAGAATRVLELLQD
jgi:hypothetical protein